MALSEQQFASLLRSLDELTGAASYLGGTALDAAAYQHACTRLSPAALHMLEAFEGFTPPPPVVAAASRASCDIERFPEDVLGALLAFVDLPMRFTCVVASRTLRDACARVSPRLEHDLVLKRFPLLTGLPVTGSSLVGVPAPKDLFRMYQDRFNGESFRAEEPESTIPFDAYTMTLELISLDTSSNVAPGASGLKSVYVGSETISPLNTGQFYGARFTIPQGLFERAFDHPHARYYVKVMVSRRWYSGRVQFARLCGGCGVREYLDFGIRFDTADDMASAKGNEALNFIRCRGDETDMWTDPTLHVRWEPVYLPPDAEMAGMQLPLGGPTVFEVNFQWSTADAEVCMSRPEVLNCLEHFVDWSD